MHKSFFVDSAVLNGARKKKKISLGPSGCAKIAGIAQVYRRIHALSYTFNDCIFI